MIQELIYCACGCGKTRLKFDIYDGTERKYIQGHYMLGKKHSEVIKEKIRLAVKGENNGNWKGNNLTYRGLHRRIRTLKPKPELCEKCQTKKAYDAANISGKYLLDVNDWIYLCRSCHMIEDQRMFNLRHQRPST